MTDLDRDDVAEDAFDRRIAAAFAAGAVAPAEFTRQVLRRIQEERWRREAQLDRWFHGALALVGVVLLLGAWAALDTLGVITAMPAVPTGGSVLQTVTAVLVLVVLWRGRKLSRT